MCWGSHDQTPYAFEFFKWNPNIKEIYISLTENPKLILTPTQDEPPVEVDRVKKGIKIEYTNYCLDSRTKLFFIWPMLITSIGFLYQVYNSTFYQSRERILSTLETWALSSFQSRENCYWYLWHNSTCVKWQEYNLDLFTWAVWWTNISTKWGVLMHLKLIRHN